MTYVKLEPLMICLISVCGLLISDAQAARFYPSMDALERAVRVFESVGKPGVLSQEQRAELRSLVRSEDAVIMCLGAYAVGNLPMEDAQLVDELKVRMRTLDRKEWPGAFVSIAIVKQAMLKKPDEHKIEQYEKLAIKENGPLAVEAAKEILKLNKDKGLGLLEELGNDSTVHCFMEAYRAYTAAKTPDHPYVGSSGLDNYDDLQALLNGSLTVKDGKFVAVEKRAKGARKDTEALPRGK